MTRTRNRNDPSVPRQRALRPTAVSGLAPGDADILDRARVDWQLGNWSALAALEPDAVIAHPERAKLGLFAAAGHHHAGDAAQARAWIRSALEWNCPPRLVAEILIAGVHNTLGRASILLQDEVRAAVHFEAAVTLAGECLPADLVAARRTHEMEELERLAPREGTT